RSLDELPPQTRRVLGSLDAWVSEQAERAGCPRESVRFTRRTVRGVLGLSDTQLRVHLERLVQLDYVALHGGKVGQRFAYSLLFDGDADSDAPQAMGLHDAAEWTKNSQTSRGQTATSRGKTATSRGESANLAGGSRPGRGGVAGGSRGVRTPLKPKLGKASSESTTANPENAHSRQLNGHAVAVQP